MKGKTLEELDKKGSAHVVVVVGFNTTCHRVVQLSSKIVAK